MGVALLLVGFGLVTYVHAQGCSRPEGGPNMFLTSDTFPVEQGAQVTFKCNIGYSAEGTSGAVTCDKGTWSPLRMRCTRKNCGSAGEVANGVINYDGGTEFGDRITITCNTGYRLVGRNEITCGDQGWLDRLPTCEVVVCPAPTPIENGGFNPEKEQYEYSEVVQYRCNGDYVLNGSRELTCKENQLFEPRPPTCVHVQCIDPVINNGRWASGSRPPHKYKASMTWRCLQGYNMIGSGTLTCGINSQWEPALPECKATECKVPEVEHGEVEGGSKPSYKISESVTFKCNTGFGIQGQSTLTCRENNQWSHAPPVCTQIVCKAPEVKHGVVVGVSQPSYKYSESVTIKCKDGFEMKGQSTLTCRDNSQWFPAPPECAQIECKAPEVKHGNVVGLSQSSYKHLESVTFECKPGYKMNGEKTLKCGHNSQWSSAPPECTLSTESGGHHTTSIVLGVFGVLAVIVIGSGILWIQKKKKRKLGRPMLPS